MVITVAILAVLLVLIIGAGFFFASSSMGIRRQTLDEARKWQEEHYDLSWYDPLEKTDYQVASYDGYMLNVELIRNPEVTDKYILLSHGYTDNRFGSLKYTKMYLDLGCTGKRRPGHSDPGLHSQVPAGDIWNSWRGARSRNLDCLSRRQTADRLCRRRLRLQ